jgi:hypothetical protein
MKSCREGSRGLPVRAWGHVVQHLHELSCSGSGWHDECFVFLLYTVQRRLDNFVNSEVFNWSVFEICVLEDMTFQSYR